MKYMISQMDFASRTQAVYIREQKLHTPQGHRYYATLSTWHFLLALRPTFDCKLYTYLYGITQQKIISMGSITPEKTPEN